MLQKKRRIRFFNEGSTQLREYSIPDFRIFSNDILEARMLLFYNMVITVILLYAALGLGFKGPALWGVIIFHTI
jgi:hypothetical protein